MLPESCLTWTPQEKATILHMPDTALSKQMGTSMDTEDDIFMDGSFLRVRLVRLHADIDQKVPSAPASFKQG